MANNAQPSPGELPDKTQASHASLSTAGAQDYLQQLQDLLRRGVLVENSVWSFKMTDWVVGLQATDIDGDGEREILVAARDGRVQAFTHYGSLKWDSHPGERLSSLAVRPPGAKASEKEPRVILGLRNGKLIALNKNGEVCPGWEYDTGRRIRQIVISEQDPDMIVLGSEDRCIHVLDGATARLRWKHATGGWVRCVCIFDLDEDGQAEIIAGSGDQHVSIFNPQGEVLFTFDTANQVYALEVARLEASSPVSIITSSNHKSLSAWHIARTRPGGEWTVREQWLRSPIDSPRFFENRIHAICAADLNKDGKAVILAGCGDGHLVVLDRAGELLWKCQFGSCVNTVSALDLNYDGQIEVLVGTEKNDVHVFQLELVEHLYSHLRKHYQGVSHMYNWKQFSEKLLPRERALLEDLTSKPPPRPPRLELNTARSLIRKKQYEKALTILLRLLQQKVQYCWTRPFQTQGYVWTSCFSSPQSKVPGELLVGTDRGYIYALDISQKEAVSRWQHCFAETDREELRNRVRMIAPGPPLSEHAESWLAVLASQRVLLLDHDGNTLQNHLLAQQACWPRSSCFDAGTQTRSAAIFLGMENQSIAIWDSSLSAQIGQITTSHGIGVVCIHDLLENGTLQIIAGSLKNGIYAYSPEGEEIWQFKTQDRIHALHIADVDLDGHPEIIAGSEDRNVYVLSARGKLKWRYPTGRGVTSIDVCNLRMPRESYMLRRQPPQILASSSDGYLYMFDGYGDLLWKHLFPNRVRMVRVCNIDAMGRYKVAVAYEDQLELLQILDKDELEALANKCWRQFTRDYENTALLRQLTIHEDPYIRGEALATLAGLSTHEKEDIQCIHRALREDNSLQVKLKLVHAIVNFCRIPQNHEENVRLARQLLEGLYRDPEREVRLELVQIFRLLANADTELFFSLLFENLERSTDHADEYVRRTAVRGLDFLLEVYPERDPRRVFSLLLKTARDEETWVRLETGRTLAHHFERRSAELVADLIALLDHRTDLPILEQITYSVRHPALKGLLQNMLRQMRDLRPDNLVEILDEAILYLGQVKALGASYGEEWLQMYEEFRQFARSTTISALAGYQRITRSDMLLETPLARVGLIHVTFDAPEEISHFLMLDAPQKGGDSSISVFDILEEVAHTIALYEKRQTVGERVSTLIQAQHLVEKLRGGLRQPGSWYTTERLEAHAPENRILALLVEQWWKVINSELARISGFARLVLSLGNSIVARAPTVVVSLLIKNDGQCAADNVHVEMEESADCEILEGQHQQLSEISTKSPAHVEFQLRLHQDSARVAFHLTYDDAERKRKHVQFADEIWVQDLQRPYRQISNPYTTGTPIRDREMFYGRAEDLIFLQNSLGRQSTNSVVLLWGQRRMGKTSLMYRLAGELATGPYAPVFIDFQRYALKENDAQLLEGFAECICDQVWHYKRVLIERPTRVLFATDPSLAFDQYLASVQQRLPDQRLILFIDEFDDMNQYITRNGDNILRYLRSLMQHYPGLNFLLAGAPHMPYMEGYQAIFFNIAQQRELGKFKPDEALELIVEPVRDDLKYDSLALEKMITVTDGWPYFIHVMSEKLIQYCNAIQKSYVTVGEINAALNLVLHEQETSIQWIWQDLSSPTEKLILSLLAQEKGEEGRIFSLNDIYRGFDANSIPYEPKKVTEALNKLVKGSFVEQEFDGVQYRIPVGLIKAWLRKEKPPERVVREENFFMPDSEF